MPPRRKTQEQLAESKKKRLELQRERQKFLRQNPTCPVIRKPRGAKTWRIPHNEVIHCRMKTVEYTDFEGSPPRIECEALINTELEEYDENTAEGWMENVRIDVEPSDVNPDLGLPVPTSKEPEGGADISENMRDFLYAGRSGEKVLGLESEWTVEVPETPNPGVRGERDIRSNNGTVSECGPFSCTFPGCCCKFYNKKTLEEHVARHNGGKEFRCGFEGCGLVFLSPQTLAGHMYSHTGKKPFVCDLEGCDRSFISQSNLDSHKVKHNYEKPYKCSHGGCDGAFRFHSELLRHWTTHTGEELFVCDYNGCQRSFLDRICLQRHIQTHTDKRHKCDCEGCGQSFNLKSELIAHKQVHEKQEPMQPIAVVISLPDCTTSYFYKM